jgi:hypothetical protein
LIAAGKPDTPYNCTIVNQTSESLEVECNEGKTQIIISSVLIMKNSLQFYKLLTLSIFLVSNIGFDGGQRQWFVMEIFDSQTNVLQANISSKYTTFTVNGLDSGKLLKVIIYAVNIKGRSETTMLESFTLKAAEKQTGNLASKTGANVAHNRSFMNIGFNSFTFFSGQHETFDRSTILSFGILVGLLTALVCVIIAIVVLLKIRSANNKKSNNKQRPGNLPIKEKISMPLSQSEEMYDEKNPDVVPSTEGKVINL